VPPSARREGLKNAYWPGRFEILGHSPYLIVDSAHNGDSASKLRAAVQDFFPGHRVILIFGASSDHPYGDVLQELLPIADETIVTRSRHPRAADPETISQTVTSLGFESSIISDVPEALGVILGNADANDLICVTGSIFTVSDARETWYKRNGLPMPPLDPEL
jgi:dihydrofolate synthase/folylpolyglutamate synthase